jgi:hypothetical protein
MKSHMKKRKQWLGTEIKVIHGEVQCSFRSVPHLGEPLLEQEG